MRMYALFALYGGPDQLMPITSGLTAIFAFVLIFWNKVLVAIGKFLKLFRASARNPTSNNEASGKREQEVS